ncbi:2-amino-4-oxopentanoate thiolase subunit OrtA [Caloramator sp. ALD01]|uniref:2-amino-4-oxopentanoate thiolase subunit OrtA n=1 Tax=Caloramator sp. ALD01 TaxID=1031288 RepID=UPI0003F74B29|nr:2-amino-4-oxopentanoate thiolase subunit OrtA [Caloramator sp. ALD01]
MDVIKKGTYVQIHQIVLRPDERASNLPDETKNVPLEMWVKGYLNSDARIGDEVEITTLTNRKVIGTLVEVNPSYRHDFGKFVPEILKIGQDLRKILKDGEGCGRL